MNEDWSRSRMFTEYSYAVHILYRGQIFGEVHGYARQLLGRAQQVLILPQYTPL